MLIKFTLDLTDHSLGLQSFSHQILDSGSVKMRFFNWNCDIYSLRYAENI